MPEDTAIVEMQRKVEQQTEALRAVREACVSELKKAIEDKGTNLISLFGESIQEEIKRREAAIADITAELQKLEYRQNKLDETGKRQTDEIDGLLVATKQIATQQDANVRVIAEHELRLNGKSQDGEKEPSIETMRRTQDNIKSTLDGTRGGVPLAMIIDKFREVSTVVNLGKFLGAGTLLSLLGVLLNINQAKGPSIDVIRLQDSVARLERKSIEDDKTINDLRVEMGKIGAGIKSSPAK